MIKLPNEGVINHRDGIETLESRLQASLTPVQPPAEFVRDLKQRLLHESELEIADPKPTLIQKVLWATAGVLSGTLLLVLGVRGVLALVSSIKNGIPPKNTATVNPV